MCEGSSLNFSSSHSAFNSYPGRPMKLNTAEAMAACLFITGYQDEARIMLGPFGYGEEFLRLNEDALNAYCSCSSGEEVAMVNQQLLTGVEEKKQFKDAKREENREGCRTDNSYLADMDLPPMDSDDEGDYFVEEEEQQQQQQQQENEQQEEVVVEVGCTLEGVGEEDVYVIRESGGEVFAAPGGSGGLQSSTSVTEQDSLTEGVNSIKLDCDEEDHTFFANL